MVSAAFHAAWFLALAHSALADASAPPPDVGSAVALLASITFVMSLIYLLLNKDKDVQKYAWTTCSGAICNFMGALIGRSWGDSVQFFALGSDTSHVPVIICWACICFSWFVILQIVLAVVSGALEDLGFPKPSHIDTMRLNVKCFATLISLVTGISNLTLWGTIQIAISQSESWIVYSGGIFTALLALFALRLIFYAFSKARHYVANMDDNTEDQFEKQWIQASKDTEDAVLNLTVAHLVVQAIRFYITGTHPAATGADPPGYEPVLKCGFILYGISLLFMLVYLHLESIPVPANDAWQGRFKRQIKGTLGNIAAFAGFWSYSWIVEAFFEYSGNDEDMILALVVTVGAFGFIYVLHKIAVLERSSFLRHEVEALVVPVSFQIGFAWKLATLAQIDTIRNVSAMRIMTFLPENYRPQMFELLTTIVIVLIVVPAWRWYILPVAMGIEVVDVVEESKDDYEELPDENEKGWLDWLWPK